MSGNPSPVPNQGCTVEMLSEQFCERAIYDAPPGVDKTPVCLMHSRDPAKDEAAFQAEFDRILCEAGDGDADFTSFVFPRFNCSGRAFKARCFFLKAIFTEGAVFGYTVRVQVPGSRVEGSVGVKFTRGADFTGATFNKAAVFVGASFMGEVSFQDAEFNGTAHFNNMVFEREAEFNEAVFAEEATFSEATFCRDAAFRTAKFKQHADFSWADFERKADFACARFSSGAEFRETHFRNDQTRLPGLVLVEAVFDNPGHVIFYRTNLGQAILVRYDVSEFIFSDVQWRTRPDNRKRMVFEEYLVFERKANLETISGGPSLDPRANNESNYGLISEVYQQLKKNYDGRCDFWTAGDFHYGEMEMKRLVIERGARSLARVVPGPARRWLHQNLGLVAWYKYASEYGESYVRPFVWLLIVLSVFTLAYPVAGLKIGKPAADAGAVHEQPASNASALTAGAMRGSHLESGVSVEIRGLTPTLSELSYTRFFEFAKPHDRVEWSRVSAFFGHSLMTVLYVGSFQKQLAFEPSYPWGHLLAFLEVLLTSTLVALFLLAVGRQCRR